MPCPGAPTIPVDSAGVACSMVPACERSEVALFKTKTIRLDGDVIASDHTIGAAVAIIGLVLLVLVVVILFRRARRQGKWEGLRAVELALLAAMLGIAVTAGILVLRMTSLALIVGAYGLLGALVGRLWMSRAASGERKRSRAHVLAMALTGVLASGVCTVVCFPRLGSHLTGEGTSVGYMMTVLRNVQEVQARVRGTYGSVENLYEEIETFPKLPGAPGTEYYSHRFFDMRSRGGVPFDRSEGYGICAVPKEYMKTGQYTVIMDQTGVVYYRDIAGRKVEDFPLDPESSGWMRDDF